jgi:chloramphenicol-sensitive protein RarD
LNLSGRGVLLSLGASVLFALITVYVPLLAPLDGLQVFAQRVVWSIPAVLLLVLLAGQWSLLLDSLRRLRSEPRLLLAMPLCAFLVGVQWALFVWAPLEGKMLDMSLGYFLLPLAMVLSGRLFYGERLSILQQLAVLCALVGVGHEYLQTRSFSWVTLLVALGYPPYFMLRRWMRLDALSGFAIEIVLMAPVAIWLIVAYGPPELYAQAPKMWLLLPGLGILSALAFGAYMGASRLLPLGLFGILSYSEPVLLFVVALLFLGETFSLGQLWTYLPIWLAVILTGIDSGRLLHKQSRRGL